LAPWGAPPRWGTPPRPGRLRRRLAGARRLRRRADGGGGAEPRVVPGRPARLVRRAADHRAGRREADDAPRGHGRVGPPAGRVSTADDLGIVRLFLGAALMCLPPARFGDDPVAALRSPEGAVTPLALPELRDPPAGPGEWRIRLDATADGL